MICFTAPLVRSDFLDRYNYSDCLIAVFFFKLFISWQESALAWTSFVPHPHDCGTWGCVLWIFHEDSMVSCVWSDHSVYRIQFSLKNSFTVAVNTTERRSMPACAVKWSTSNLKHPRQPLHTWRSAWSARFETCENRTTTCLAPWHPSLVSCLLSNFNGVTAVPQRLLFGTTPALGQVSSSPRLHQRLAV